MEEDNVYNANYIWNIPPYNNPGRCTQFVMVILGGSEFLTYTYKLTHSGIQIDTAHMLVYRAGSGCCSTNGCLMHHVIKPP
jgi:hypothetical protein